jgi:hypothetical protein
MLMAVFWVVAMCDLVNCTSVSEILAASNIWAMAPKSKDSHLRTRRLESLISYYKECFLQNKI